MPDLPKSGDVLSFVVRNLDGTYVTVFVTITDSQLRFSVRTVNGSATVAKVRVVTDGFTDIVVDVPPGEKTDWDVGTRQYDKVRSFQLQAAS